MVSAVTLIGIAIMKAPGASSFRAHANPQEHCSPGGYNIAVFQVHSSDELHFSGSFGICHYQEQDLRFARRFFGFVLAALCLPGVSVNLVGARVKASLTFVCKYELRVLVSVKRKAGIQRPASWNYSSLRDDNVISLRCGLKCSHVLPTDRTGSAVSNGCFGISWPSVEHRLRFPGKQNMRIVGNSSIS